MLLWSLLHKLIFEQTTLFQISHISKEISKNLEV